jgi:nucleoside-diphosphate-sugar epimerase
MSTVLVTGGAGFIGSNLVDALPITDEVVIFDSMMRGHESKRNLNEIGRPYALEVGDVRDAERVRDVVAKYKPDVIYHLAALPSHRLALTKPPLDYVTVDVLGTLNVLDAARRHGGSVVFASSNKVYGHQPIPHEECMPKSPEGPYGQAKATSEDYCYQYSRYHGVSSVAIRFHHAVGKRCHSELVLPMFVERALQGEPITANGRMVDGLWKWCAADFTNIHDIVDGLKLFLAPWWRTEPSFRYYNFGTGKITTVKQLAEMVIDATRSRSAIHPGVAMEHEGLEHLAKVYKARLELDWSAQRSIRASVQEYVDWRKGQPEPFLI